ncbi:MAG: hypothetical protein OXG60_13075 [Chloroflexi bacterium]|nr:hypothetical protein [Chloroflexota bacterium]
MAWTTPKTDWSTGELVAAADLNSIGDNLAALRNLGKAAYTTTKDIVSNTRNFTHIDGDNLNLTITTTGGDVLVHFHGSIGLWDGQSVFLDIEVDGSRLGGNDGLLRHQFVNVSGSAQVANLVSFTRLIQNLSPGSHTFKLQSKETYSNTLKAGAQFWLREI